MIQIVIYTQKYYYLLEIIDEKIEILKSSGLINFWNEQFIDQSVVHEKDVMRPKVLSTVHLMGCFQIWIFRIMVFIVEKLEVLCGTRP